MRRDHHHVRLCHHRARSHLIQSAQFLIFGCNHSAKEQHHCLSHCLDQLTSSTITSTTSASVTTSGKASTTPITSTSSTAITASGSKCHLAMCCWQLNWLRGTRCGVGISREARLRISLDIFFFSELQASGFALVSRALIPEAGQFI